MGNKSSDLKGTRNVVAGVVTKDDEKKSNAIKTSKYTLLTFVPKNFIEQFRRVANFFFATVIIISLSIDSPVSPLTTGLAFFFIIVTAMTKQGYEDWLRHRADNIVNNEQVFVIKKNNIKSAKCRQIRPGDLVKINQDCDVPCDAVLLWTSDTRGKCFVTTANLDGETSLKPLRVPAPLLHGNFEDSDKTKINIEFSPPESDIHTFYGKLEYGENQSTSIGTENLLLRGSRVKNVEWAIGCAIYTGEDTKLALNSKFKSNKFSSCESYINNFLIFFILLMLAKMTMSFFLKRHFERQMDKHQEYIGPFFSDNSFGSIVQDFFSFMMLYSYTIPISLYVSIEFHKLIGKKFFEWDNDLTCFETSQLPLVNSSDLNEELGQIEILFSDKTGTLTKNNMFFHMCSINGKLYIEKDTLLYETKIGNSDIDNLSPINILEPDVEFFFKILALCHTVQIEEISTNKTKIEEATEKDNSNSQNIPAYQAMSADEISFVKAAANRGIIFNGDELNQLCIKYQDGSEESYTKLHVLEFTSVRKRMSIIIRDSKGKIWLFCKGAESAIFPLCVDSPLKTETNSHIQYFAEKGLRTLAIGYKELTEEQYESIKKEIDAYAMDIKRRMSNEGMVNEWKSIEDGLTLIGGTAVEDSLQDNVTETMVAIREAGIKIWVLTGDKIETAINVAQSCGHIPSNSKRLFLAEILNDIDIENQLQMCLEVAKDIDNSSLTLILDGQSLALILGTEKEKQFVELSLKCEAVVCCRLSPLQKAQIIKLIKKSPGKPITAAVGDGANDISMIQEAHVGFGIFGKEGRQAARAADFSFAQFMMLKKVFLVHGHWYYERFATLIQYSFYKNFCFVLLMITCNFSTQSIIDAMFHINYNFFFTSVPIVVISLSDHCHSVQNLMSNPTLYKNHNKNKLLSWKYFFGWCSLGLYHSIVIYTLHYGLWYYNSAIYENGHVTGQWCFGTALYHCLVIVMNLKVWLHARYQTLIFIASLLGSVVVFMGFAAGYAYSNFINDGDMYGVYPKLLTSATFWFMNILVAVVTMSADLLYNACKNTIKGRYPRIKKISLESTDS